MCNVGRVRHDRIHSRSEEGRQQRPGPQLDGAAERGAAPAHVFRRHLEGCRRDVGRNHALVVPFGREGDGNGPASRPNVGHGTAGDAGEHLIDEPLGFLAGNEHPLVHLEGEVPKRGPSDGVGERCAAGSAQRGRTGPLDDERSDDLIAVLRRPEARPVDDGRDHVARLSPRLLDVRVPQHRFQLGHQLAGAHRLAHCLSCDALKGGR